MARTRGPWPVDSMVPALEHLGHLERPRIGVDVEIVGEHVDQGPCPIGSGLAMSSLAIGGLRYFSRPRTGNRRQDGSKRPLSMAPDGVVQRIGLTGTTVDIIRVSSSIFQEAASADGVIDKSETTPPRAMRSFCNTGIVICLARHRRHRVVDRHRWLRITRIDDPDRTKALLTSPKRSGHLVVDDLGPCRCRIGLVADGVGPTETIRPCFKVTAPPS